MPEEKEAALRIRRAGAEDERVARLIYGDPSAEAAGIAGGRQRAARLGRGLFAAGAGSCPGDEFFLALRGERACGVLLGRIGGSSFSLSPGPILRLLPLLFRLYAPWELPGLLDRARKRSRLECEIPAGSYHIVELHVDPDCRGEGIGAALLEHAEEIARGRGCLRINLTTALANPARRLYARCGYVELDRRTLPGYEAWAGTPGRVLLDKALEAAKPKSGEFWRRAGTD